MFTSKVLLDFVSLAPRLKVVTYRNIIIKLTGNIYFVTPDIPLADLVLALGNFESALIASADGSHTAKAFMKEKELIADTAFRTEAAYVQRVSNGDEAKILSSGFEVARHRSVHQKSTFSVIDGPNSGSVKLVGLRVEKSGSYDFQMYQGDNPEGEAGWVTIGQSTSATFVVTGLTPFTKYYFRYCAVTTHGVTDYCAPVLKYVL